MINRTETIIYVHKISSPLGVLTAAALDEGLCLLDFDGGEHSSAGLKDLKKKFKARIETSQNRHLRKLEKQLGEYFKGSRTKFDVPLVLTGTPFQRKAWKVLMKVPWGETRTYKEQAISVGNQKSVRAVARANGQNRIGIVIPCHRIIGSNGKLVGYGGGLWRKKYLLDLEDSRASL